MIVNGRKSSYKLKREESIAIAEIIEEFNKNDSLIKI